MDALTVLVVVVLVTLSGLFSGLTLGLMSLSLFDLKRKVKLKNPYAIKIYPLRKKGNLLLSTLIFGNVAVNATLSIFLGSLTTGIIAGLIATGLIVLFGEVLPQSIYSRYALEWSAHTAFLVYPFLILFYPVTKPLSMVINYFLGGESPQAFTRKEFQVFLEQQKSFEELDSHEYKLLERGLRFSEKTVKDVMTPRANAFLLEQNTALTKKVLHHIHQQGHSRIPVYKERRSVIIGLLYTKDLATIDPDDKILVKDKMKQNITYVKEHDELGDVLNLFKQKRMHLFMVRNVQKHITGIITFEDVIEEIIGEIVDEYDLITDMRKSLLHEKKPSPSEVQRAKPKQKAKSK
jgi:metal transporter CNNM